MMSDGVPIGDGSWMLRVFVTELQVEKTLRVKGDLLIRDVLLRLKEELDIAMDWLDQAFWWPARNQWLTTLKSTLDQYGVHADSFLHLTPMHKTLRLQLPDLQYLDCRVDFSIKTFNAVIQICRDLGIRHPEELSLCKPLEPNNLKYNLKDLPGYKKKSNTTTNGTLKTPDTNTFIAAGPSPAGSVSSLENAPPFLCAPVTPRHHHAASTPISSPMNKTGTWKNNNSSDFNKSYSLNGTFMTSDLMNSSFESSLTQSPTPSHEAKAHLQRLRPKSLVERARMNVAWLDSSLSIMQQGVREFDTLRLRFKFYSFYDLNPKIDGVRINQIYEQAKWMLLNEELDCTEEEALMFAALQLQIQLQAGVAQPNMDGEISSLSPVDDDIEKELQSLQEQLEGSSISSSNDITQVPELYDHLRFFKPKRFTLKAFKRYWFTCRELRLRLYKNKEDVAAGIPPVYEMNLKGCEVSPDISLAQRKFQIKLEVAGPDGMSESYIRCDDENQYAKWMAACRLASKGRSLADSSYESEKNSILEFLSMQQLGAAPAINPASLDISSEDFIAPRFQKKLKSKAVQRILEAHANVKDLPLVEAKLNYIKGWQSLPDYGISLFLIKFNGHKKEELLGVAYNRLMRMDLSGDHIKTWRYNNMKAWNVNWEVKLMMVQFEDESILFGCESADCKVIHEFIGGYIFLSMRSKEANQALNEEMFHKLTGGWV